ncbi:IS3 ORF2 [Escherichia coli B171]|nr:IS3 ORF2 [Escherichia coli B171]EFR14846.1 putative transposase [Escherichia coli 2362-75]EFX24351.1 IS3 protein [Escherichia coli O55:H7 str. 3256-97]EFX34233.1 IS3 protein [Escherichia coli O157:H7 str. LSU-61]EFZ44989.1 putative transposase [Escherichia coli E128010]EHU06175.1 putative IS3 transposase [Escherichia coli DEC1A]EHU07298.1 putative IS3 transposase [Escherichia coli DEC1C]EHU22507.1 putative IS3 transposase [Escherichia coli DEC1E]EHU26473.1 putative IS3 transposase [Esche
MTLTFFHSLKVECIHGERFSSREIMRETVFNYIECDYNRWRRHSACGGLSPDCLALQIFRNESMQFTSKISHQRGNGLINALPWY